jgi:hypothetical protein
LGRAEPDDRRARDAGPGAGNDRSDAVTGGERRRRPPSDVGGFRAATGEGRWEGEV